MKTILYNEKYDKAIQNIDMILFFTIKYHNDVLKDTVTLAVDGRKVCGVGYLKAGATFLKVEKENLPYYFIHSEIFTDVSADPALQVGAMSLLLAELKRRFLEIQDKYSDKRLILRMWSPAENLDFLEFLMEHGFRQMRLTPIMVKSLTKKDIKKDDTDLSFIEEGLHIREMDPNNDEFLKAYMVTNREAFEVEDSGDEMKFMMGGADSHVWAVMKEDRVIAALSTWQISEKRAATENIFCAEDYRKKGVTSALIKYVFSQLRKSDYREASLTVFGDNQPAMQLYLKLGYVLNGELIECHFEKEYKNIGF